MGFERQRRRYSLSSAVQVHKKALEGMSTAGGRIGGPLTSHQPCECRGSDGCPTPLLQLFRLKTYTKSLRA